MDFLDLDTSLKVTKQNVILYSNWLAYNKTNLDAIPQSSRSSYIKDSIGFVESNPGAIISFIKKSGLADSQLKSSIISSAIANKIINYNEYCLIHLSKECLFLNNGPKVNILALICKYIINTPSKKIDLKKIRELGLDLNAIPGNINGNRRTDYVSTILEGTGLFTYVGNREDGIMELKDDAEPIITFLDSCNLEESLLPLNSAERFDYFSSDKGGILNYLNMPLPEIWKTYYPNLSSSLSFDKSQSANGYLKNAIKLSLQQIFYGAPGTGKSSTIKHDAEEQGHVHFRTTFHPDSDYSTFVGCYKPTKEQNKTERKQVILDYDTLVDKFKEYLNAQPSNITRACALFGYDFHDSIVSMQESSHSIVDLVADAYKTGSTYDSVLRAGMSVYESSQHDTYASASITYDFVPQAFTKAYCEAWNKYDGTAESEPVFLIIEEINRGNCAQIFGDIFQLLDRETVGERTGFSTYPIDADEDLKKFLLTGTKEDGSRWLTNEDGIKGGKLCLPPNLYIWATMNTSDQSLFPIDSAFKRRWDWTYIRISEGRDKDTKEPLHYSFEVNHTAYDWWSFLKIINERIGSITSSEDKKLGYFFCGSEKGNISAQKFVSKVCFYLWNDVFKDFGFGKKDQSAAFKKENGKDLAFDDFYMEDPETFKSKVDETMLENFIVKLGVETVEARKAREESAQAQQQPEVSAE